jgi:hypothetical protein
MTKRPSLHSHAVECLEARFDVDRSWLLQELENGRFVWLKGAGDSGSLKKVRSGHLIYIPNIDEYCVVIMDDRSRLAITVLTESMALKSSWARGVNETAKLRAKRIALGYEKINDANFLQLYAEERNGLSVNVRVITISYNWKRIVLSLCKVTLIAEQINPKENYCTLNESQMINIQTAINNLVTDKKILPYCEFYVSTAKGKTTFISNKIDGISCLENAEQARRLDFPNKM